MIVVVPTPEDDGSRAGAAIRLHPPSPLITAAAESRLATLRRVIADANRSMSQSFYDQLSVDPGDVVD